ncbi:MAG: hypothetical protein A3F70_07690 [Acidobacteria bacterium RIFCSPLOWO2_12_FULL_67_14]|nr:MAG: hypothetical protein A3H29_14180 [Acidobacteria bacterium RIFCSPLOWO2_02_FULL_67_21]OFW35205.1 MAG: hypothetical protein A3F70_07690 [Acidobacteria bacterium RIFCSPLOWO2_12_FULL_67_14]
MDSAHIKWIEKLLDQRRQWTVPVTQPMMLCSQIPRAGGTLLTRLFDGHPACFAHPFELQWGRPRSHWPQLDLSAEVTPQDLYDRMHEQWPRKAVKSGFEKYPKWTHRHHPDTVERHPFLFDPCLQQDIFAAALSRLTAREQRGVLNAYLTSLFNAWLDYQNLYRGPKQWVTAFRARLIMEPGGAEPFFADYPDGLLVTIVREPGGWLSSYTRHMDVDDAEPALNAWLASADASVRAHAARPDQVVVLLFEDLVHRTESVMRMLCERMRLLFSEVLLEPTYNSMPVPSDSSHRPATGIDRGVTERYRETLTPEQMAIVTEQAMPRFRDIQARFGLER